MSDTTTHTRQVTVDRIEGNQVVLIDARHQVVMPLEWLPPNCREGTLLTLTMAASPDDEDALRKRIEAMQKGFVRS